MTRVSKLLAFFSVLLFASAVLADDSSDRVADAMQNGTLALLAAQEGPNEAEWPYEGVYRVKGEIPIGYRVGGTGICGMALLAQTSPSSGEAIDLALHRATAFVTGAIEHPLMNPEFESPYDVRGWGYTYGLLYLLDLESHESIPDDLAPAVKAATLFYLRAIEATEFQTGGWNYARRGNRSSPFMTAPTLLALFKARQAGYEVDDEVVNRAIEALESSRTPSGAIVYAGTNGASSREAIPGSVGRMLAAESALYLAGRSSVLNIRAAVDAFITHWEWLDQRRAQNGTHVKPYGVAPYYFYYAHYFAAFAVELLPEQDRAEYRRRVHGLIFSVRQDDGLWNDRVFPRSSSYSTAMVMLALAMPEMDEPARWAE